MKARIPPKGRVDPKIWSLAQESAIQKAIEICRDESEDVLMRASNMWMLAMALDGLSPRTAERIKKRLEETVIPMWQRYIKPDDVTGKGDGDWAIMHKLEERGYPYYQPKTEM